MRGIILKVLKEEVSKGKVTCDNCGWSWKLSEGGHDPYICHQCNHNNQPKNLKESYRHPNPESFKKYFKLVKKYWDKVGLTKDSEEKAKKYILDSTVSFPFVLVYLGGREKFLETISDKIQGKIFDCENCDGYNFKYYVDGISLDENVHYREINVNAIIDTTSLSGRTYSYEDGFTDVDYEKLLELEGSEFYTDVFLEIKAAISVDLEKKIDAPFELYIEVETLKFKTFD